VHSDPLLSPRAAQQRPFFLIDRDRSTLGRSPTRINKPETICANFLTRIISQFCAEKPRAIFLEQGQFKDNKPCFVFFSGD
jgi:hypothetical protein